MAKMVTLADIDKVKSGLRALPPKESDRATRKVAIQIMRLEIEGAISKGYTLEEIVAIIIQTNSDMAGISLATIRSYLKEDRMAAKKRAVDKPARKPRVVPETVMKPKRPKEKRTSAGLTEEF